MVNAIICFTWIRNYTFILVSGKAPIFKLFLGFVSGWLLKLQIRAPDSYVVHIQANVNIVD